MREDARKKFRRGSELTQAKMTEETVRQARREYIEGRQKINAVQRRYGVQGLADRFGISKAAMEKILSRDTWEHVE